MLHIQRALLVDKLRPADLANTLMLNVYEHPDLPLIGFKYNQLDSPKTHPIVREARGLVLEKDSWNVVAKAFNRFFNVGEFAEEYQTFNWSSYHATSKEDGSLILLYHYAGEWRINTSGSFGLGQPSHCPFSWTELFWKVAEARGLKEEALQKGNTYVMELCTPYNKVVCKYNNAQLFLLSVFQGELEFSESEVDSWAKQINVARPRRWSLSSHSQARDLILEMNSGETILEGLVLRDSNNLRYKWKTDRYTALHHLHDNGNLISPSRLVAIAQAGESSEVLAYFPEITSALREVNEVLDSTYQNLETLWQSAKDSPTRKDFALKVKDHPLCPLLFNLYGKDLENPLAELRKQWLGWDPDKLSKTLFSKKKFVMDFSELGPVV